MLIYLHLPTMQMDISPPPKKLHFFIFSMTFFHNKKVTVSSSNVTCPTSCRLPSPLPSHVSRLMSTSPPWGVMASPSRSLTRDTRRKTRDLAKDLRQKTIDIAKTFGCGHDRSKTFPVTFLSFPVTFLSFPVTFLSFPVTFLSFPVT